MTDAAKLKEAIDLYNSGASSTKVAQFLGTYGAEALRILRENGVTIRSRGRPGKAGPARRRSGTVEDILRLYGEGFTLREIAEQLNTGWQNISHLLIRNGYKASELERPWRLTPKRKEILDSYQAGMSPKEIHAKYGTARGTIDIWRKLAGYEKQPDGFFARGPEYHKRNKEVAERYQKGDKVYQIASDLGIPEPTIYVILRRQGIQPSRRPTCGRWGPRNAPKSTGKVKSVTTTPFNRDKKLIKRITTLRDSSFNYDTIAAIVGVSRSTVQRIASSN